MEPVRVRRAPIADNLFAVFALESQADSADSNFVTRSQF
jgi:hypothetical protein